MAVLTNKYMPYYEKSKILFIHIPKTAGTYIEKMLKNNDKEILRSGFTNNILPAPYNSKSLQHQFYSTLAVHSDVIKIDFSNNMIKKFSIVRNPYDRVASAILWPIRLRKSLIKETTLHNSSIQSPQLMSANEFYTILKRFINKSSNVKEYNDNHSEPQYKFVCDSNDKLYDDIRIFKCETLHDDNKAINDFLQIDISIPKHKAYDYSGYFNNDSIKLVNEYYKKDFELFGYEMKSV